MDLNPFLPLGIDAHTAHFLDTFLLHCLLSDSPPDTPDEIAALARNQQHTAARGREPGLRLERDGQQVLLTDWARELVQACAPIAERLDAALGGEGHRAAWALAAAALGDPTCLPSAKVVAAMTADTAGGHAAFARAQSALAREAVVARALPHEVRAQFEEQAVASLAEQASVEAADIVPFEVFRQEYVSAAKLEV